MQKKKKNNVNIKNVVKLLDSILIYDQKSRNRATVVVPGERPRGERS